MDERVVNLREQNRIIDKPQITEDDIVLIVDENLPRNVWQMGRVLRLIRGADNVVRGETLKTSKNCNYLRDQKTFAENMLTRVACEAKGTSIRDYR
eukprot:gene14858-5982_t